MKNLQKFESYSYAEFDEGDKDLPYYNAHQIIFQTAADVLDILDKNDIIQVYQSLENENLEDLDIVNKFNKLTKVADTISDSIKKDITTFDDGTDVEEGLLKYKILTFGNIKVLSFAWYDYIEYNGDVIAGFMLDKQYMKFFESFSPMMFKEYTFAELIDIYNDLDGDVAQLSRMTESISSERRQGNYTIDRLVFDKAVEHGSSDLDDALYFEYDTHYDHYYKFHYDNKDLFKTTKVINEKAVYQTPTFTYDIEMEMREYETVKYAIGKVSTDPNLSKYNADFSFIVIDSQDFDGAIREDIPLRYIPLYRKVHHTKKQYIRKLIVKGQSDVLDLYLSNELTEDELIDMAKMAT